MSAQDYTCRDSTTIRQPATANLMIDSADRVADISGGISYFRQTPFNFTIQKNQQLMNGFFHRIGTSEVVLEWDVPNINSALNNTLLRWDISGQTVSTIIGDGFYTVAELLDQIPDSMNISMASAGLPSTSYGLFSTVPLTTTAVTAYQLRNTQAIPYNFSTTKLINTVMTEPSQHTNSSLKTYRKAIDLRPFRYIDFVSEQLTYNQQLKDNDTTSHPRSVLNRWYFDWDSPPDFDFDGFPIYMGYTPFRARRIYNPPKQIRWESNQPLGNLSFQVYDEDGQNLEYLRTSNTAIGAGKEDYTNSTNWLMTLQISEN